LAPPRHPRPHRADVAVATGQGVTREAAACATVPGTCVVRPITTVLFNFHPCMDTMSVVSPWITYLIYDYE